MSAIDIMMPNAPTEKQTKECARCQRDYVPSKYSTDILCVFCTEVGDTWSFAPLIATAEVPLPAGKYFIGDLCYVSDAEEGSKDHAWAAFDANGYQDGLYSSAAGNFMVASTAYGDGSYEDSMGNFYGVDGGNLSIVAVDVLPKDTRDGIRNNLPYFCDGKIFDFPSRVNVRMTGRLGGSDEENGQFEFKWTDEQGKQQILTIDTANWGDEEAGA
jgi:hypothetical protein